MYWGFNDGDLNVWKYEGKTIWDKFSLRVNIGGDIVWRFFTCIGLTYISGRMVGDRNMP